MPRLSARVDFDSTAMADAHEPDMSSSALPTSQGKPSTPMLPHSTIPTIPVVPFTAATQMAQLDVEQEEELEGGSGLLALM